MGRNPTGLAVNSAYTSAASLSTPNTHFPAHVTYHSATSVTLASSITSNVSRVPAALGPHHTAPIQAAINAADGSQRVEIPKPAGTIGSNYLIAGQPTLAHPMTFRGVHPTAPRPSAVSCAGCVSPSATCS